MRAEMVIQERRPLDPEAPIIEVFKNLDNGPHCEGLIIPLSKNYFGLMTQVIGNRRLLSIVIDTMNARQPAVLSGELMIADERVLTTRFLCYRIGEADDESLDPGDVYYRDDIHVDEFLNENAPFFIAKTGQRYSSYEISQEIGVDP